MKMYKFEIHVLDFEKLGPEQYEEMLDNVRHIIGKVFHVKSTDIGEWSDDHLLNKTNDIDTWNKYYDTTRKS
jgi:hypothetical protein